MAPLAAGGGAAAEEALTDVAPVGQEAEYLSRPLGIVGAFIDPRAAAVG